MDKIKQALERARNERNENISGARSPGGYNSDKPAIQYTQTQSVSASDKYFKEKRILCSLEASAYTRAIQMLRTQVLQKMNHHNWNVLAVTSACHDAGTTLTAINLGISIASEVDYTVLVVDANLKKPSLHEYLNIQSKKGLSDYLKNNVSLSELLIHPEDIERFVVLPGGSPLENSSEMLASAKMNALVEELKIRYPKRIIIFDLPPLLGESDTLAFCAIC